MEALNHDDTFSMKRCNNWSQRPGTHQLSFVNFFSGVQIPYYIELITQVALNFFIIASIESIYGVFRTVYDLN